MKTITEELITGICVLIFIVIALFGVTFITPYVMGNVTNGTTKTYVNVTNTEPHIYRLVITPDPITLSPGNRTWVNCTAYVFDWNGWQDVANGKRNATFYDQNYNWSAADDNNYHYSNTNCSNCTDLADADGTNASCTCSFNLYYYANDTTWICNFSAADSGGAYSNRTNQTNWTVATAYVAPLIAIDVPQEIDYGSLGVTETSGVRSANLTNFGNININISIDGWGGDNETEGENLSMICRRAQDGRNVANISVGYERYSYDWNISQNYSNMINLTSDFVNTNVTLHQRINDTNRTNGYDINSTFWRIYIPPGVTGFCNGTVRFTAVSMDGV